MLKVFYPWKYDTDQKLQNPWQKHISDFFEINQIPYSIFTDLTFDSNQVDLAIVYPNNVQGLVNVDADIKIHIMVTGNYENQNLSMYNNWYVSEDSIFRKHNVYTITNAISSDNYSNFIFNDFLFNRTKLFFSTAIHKIPLRNTIWWYEGIDAYKLPNLDVKNKTKIFLVPNKTVHNPGDPIRKFRTQLVDFFIKTSDQDRTWLPLWRNVRPETLFSQRELPDFDFISQFPTKMRYSNFKGCTIHNAYYHDTFISVYSETIETGSSLAVTEKTFTPLIKGHFILPFSVPRFVKRLKDFYGFRFPDFIDYRYDEIENDDERFISYCQEIKRLHSLKISQWSQYWIDNFDLLLHNRRIFFDKGFQDIEWPARRDSNSRLPVSKTGTLVQLSYGPMSTSGS